MVRGRGFAIVGGAAVANAVLMGAALATTRPIQYLVIAALLGTFINLAYIIAGRLWQERP